MRRFVPCFVALVLLTIATPASAYQDYSPGQWALRQINAAAAWQVSTGNGITVGVVDTGADAGHPDFGGRVSTVDCTGGSCRGGGDDQNGHGTHVTGIIAAANDGSGTTGVAPNIHVIVARVFQCDSSACNSPGASETDIQAGVDYLLSQHVAAINLSLGDPGVFGTNAFCNNDSFRSLAQHMWDAGSVGVFAAGNCGSSLLGGQALSGANALIVAAMGGHDEPASYNSSMSGVKWGLAAPGGNPSGQCRNDGTDCVLSTWPRSRSESNTEAGPYYLDAGTSMAAPHVTAAVGVLRAAGFDRDRAVNTIMSSLDGVSCGTGCQGRLNLQRALGAANISTPPPTTPASTPGFGSAAAPRTSTTRKSTPRPTVVTAAPTTAPPQTTTTELATTTTEPPARPHAALPPKHASSDASPGAVPLVIAVAGLVVAGAATGAAAWRRRRAT
jgi:hypothetical protein